jgi:transcriptional regulator with XRE-family HTH domain
MPILARKTGMRKSKTKPTMTDVLKTAIKESGVSRYRIAQDTGILETSLSRFMRGETSLRLDRADVLAEYLGLRLVLRQHRKGEK